MLDICQRRLFARVIAVILIIAGLIMFTWVEVGGAGTFAKWLVAALCTVCGVLLAIVPMEKLEPVLQWLRVRGF